MKLFIQQDNTAIEFNKTVAPENYKKLRPIIKLSIITGDPARPFVEIAQFYKSKSGKGFTGKLAYNYDIVKKEVEVPLPTPKVAYPENTIDPNDLPW